MVDRAAGLEDLVSVGITISGGCLVLDGGCLATGPCVQNTDPCLAGCYARFYVMALSTLGTSPLTTWHRVGDYFVVDTGYDASGLATTSDRDFDCASPTDSTITLSAVTSKWEWLIPGKSGTLTTVSAGLDCPPMGNDQWVWVNDGGGGSSDPSYYPLSVRPCATPSFPATTSSLAAGSIIDNFTTSLTTTPFASITAPPWDGTIPGKPGTDATWEVSPVAVRAANGEYVDQQTVTVIMQIDAAGCGSAEISILGFFSGVGVWRVVGGDWFSPLAMESSSYTIKGPLWVALGLA